MSIFESAFARILPSLSDLLGAELQIAAGFDAESDSSFVVRGSIPPVSIVAPGGRAFAPAERRLLQEMCELVRLRVMSESRFEELEHRMIELQRENLDLTVKNRALSEVSSRDTLTGLYNRWFVVEKIESEINRSLRHGSPMSLLMLDVDHFKRINDTWGHGAGDEVLKSIGRLLRESCRVYDIPGRYGGEEFCILLPETLTGSSTVVAERIRRRLEQEQLRCAGTPVTITASMGIAGMDEPGEVLSPATLIERADRALYVAKNRGRNRIETWDREFSGSALSH